MTVGQIGPDFLEYVCVFACIHVYYLYFQECAVICFCIIGICSFISGNIFLCL